MSIYKGHYWAPESLVLNGNFLVSRCSTVTNDSLLTPYIADIH
jgi:hypothetical protein